jgi:hypothetical protein
MLLFAIEKAFDFCMKITRKCGGRDNFEVAGKAEGIFYMRFEDRLPTNRRKHTLST